MKFGLISCRSLLQCQSWFAIGRKLQYHKEAIPVSWKKPESGWTKLNFDGSCKAAGATGNNSHRASSSIGGVFRNHRAEFLLGYAESIGSVSSSTVAELEALRRGLELTLEHGWMDVWLEGDAKSLVDMIVDQRKNCCGAETEEEVKRHVRVINLIIPELNNCVVTHVYREGNRAADKLAKIGHGLDRPKLWHVPPSELLHIVNEDAQGKIILRRRSRRR